MLARPRPEGTPVWELPEFAPGYAAGTFDDRYDEEPLDEREKRVRRERAELLRDDGQSLLHPPPRPSHCRH